MQQKQHMSVPTSGKGPKVSDKTLCCQSMIFNSRHPFLDCVHAAPLCERFRRERVAAERTPEARNRAAQDSPRNDLAGPCVTAEQRGPVCGHGVARVAGHGRDVLHLMRQPQPCR